MTRRLAIGSVRGVDISVDWSWIVTFVMAAWTLVSLGRRLLPEVDNARLSVAGAAFAAGIFASLVVHEIAHGLVARASGVPVKHVTLFLLGGITDAERSPSTARGDVLAALAAPAASVVLGALLVVGVAIAGGPLPRDLGDLDRIGMPGVVALGLAFANFGIAALNLLPAWPLDGGRLVRAGFWAATGDVERATRWAAWISQLIGWTMLVLGVAIAFSAHGPGVPAGMWMALVGWFIASAAAQGYEGVLVQDALAGVRVDSLMQRAFVSVAADLSVAHAARGWLAGHRDRALPVVEGTALVGFITPRDVRSVRRADRAKTLVGTVARQAPFVRPTDSALEALERLEARDLERIAVVAPGEGEGGRDALVGILEREDLVAFVDACAGKARAGARGRRAGNPGGPTQSSAGA